MTLPLADFSPTSSRMSQSDFDSTHIISFLERFTIIDAMYQKIVNKGHLDYCYLKIRLDFEDERIPDLDAVAFKLILLKAVSTLFGVAGASSEMSILKYDPADLSAIVRIKHQSFVQFWSSLTLYGNHNGQTCAFRILQVSAHLMGLANNTRTMDIQTV